MRVRRASRHLLGLRMWIVLLAAMLLPAWQASPAQAVSLGTVAAQLRADAAPAATAATPRLPAGVRTTWWDAARPQLEMAALSSGDVLNPTPNWTVSGQAVNDNVGFSVASAGDVNKDGYGDVIVGAFFFGSGAGKAFLYLGSASGLGTSPVWTATGEGTNNFLALRSQAPGM